MYVSDYIERYVEANLFDKRRYAYWRCYQGNKKEVV